MGRGPPWWCPRCVRGGFPPCRGRTHRHKHFPFPTRAEAACLEWQINSNPANSVSIKLGAIKQMPARERLRLSLLPALEIVKWAFICSRCCLEICSLGFTAWSCSECSLGHACALREALVTTAPSPSALGSILEKYIKKYKIKGVLPPSPLPCLLGEQQV